MYSIFCYRADLPVPCGTKQNLSLDMYSLKMWMLPYALRKQQAHYRVLEIGFEVTAAGQLVRGGLACG